MTGTGASIIRFILVLAAILLVSAAEATLAGRAPAFIEASLGKTDKIWTGQRVNMSITLYATTSFSGTTRINLPKVSGILIMENTDRPLLGSTTIDGVSYVHKTHEINLFPMRSGTLTVPALEVEFGYRKEDGQVANQSFRTKNLQFTALEIPGADPGKMVITSTDLKIEDRWNPTPDKAKVGDALTRTITFLARDVTGMAFPAFEPQKVDGLGLYRKNPRVSDQTHRGEFTGQRTETITYVCEKQGRFSIPAMTLLWWNPSTEELKEISLEAVSIEVAANPLLETEGRPGTEQQITSGFPWKPASAALLVLTAAVIGLLWVRHFKHRQSFSGEPSEADLFRQFRGASATNDTAKIMQTLMHWLDRSGLTGDCGRLDLLVCRSGDTDLGRQVQALEAILFSAEEFDNNDGSWSAIGLYRAVKRARGKLGQADIRSKAREEGLPTLNP